MKTRPYPRWISWIFVLSAAALGFTGVLQMPLAMRYALTEVPGMAWTGDFFLVHRLHYVFGAVLLFVAAVAAVNWWLGWRERLVLSRSGLARAAIVAGLLVSGGLRVYRNLPGVTLPPEAILVIEWTHLLLAMALGVAALIALIRGASAYAWWK